MAETERANEKREAKEPGGAIDLDHLDRQTLGDASLRDEVLAMFAAQMAQLRGELGACAGEARARLAHRVKGTAAGVGAWALAESAGRLHDAPDRDDFASDLADRADEAVRVVAKMRKDGAFWRS